jgi:hypothetical protein
MIRVKSIKKRTNKAKRALPVRGEVLATQKENKQSKKRRCRYASCGTKQPGQNPIPSESFMLVLALISLVPFSFARDTGARRCRCSVAFDQL